MHIAAPFALEFTHKEWIDEFNLIYKPKNKTEDMINFLIDNQEKRINVWFKEDSFNIDAIKTFSKIHPEFYVVFREPFPHVADLVEQVVDNEIKFYFDMYASNYSELNLYLSLGCSDVWIWGDLMYDLITVREVCNSYGARIRIILNKIPAPVNIPSVKDPFFRPQDLELVEKYFDTAEFICGDTDGFDPTHFDWRYFKMLYRHWFERRKWIGDLREINLDVNFFFPCLCFSPRFFEKKTNCQLKCYKNRPCNSCDASYNMALALQEKGLMVEST